MWASRSHALQVQDQGYIAPGAQLIACCTWATRRRPSSEHCIAMLNGLSVARIEVLLFPVASVMRPLDPTPSLQPHYEPSSLLRVGPSQCSASVRSPRGFRRLGFSLRIRATGSCSSTRQPASASRPLYAGRRPLGHQAPCRLVPGGIHAPGFDDS